ncbi:sodium channel modifier 1-like [Iris pallida]|uniref:Sodium channel modifier 1 n=1 Tax=Iris pallida TaxID=29817 RepID=A0AAX6HS08_IRIPA|nr:sodium channel modifier 1-like [Iris pallida]
MSVFGGDSWAREAQQRKRRVDELVLSTPSSSSSFKKLSNGSYACLICSQSPILSGPLSISLHSKGSRHIAAESRMKERELSRQAELNKRIALSSDSAAVFSTVTSTEQQKDAKLFDKPLIKQTRKAIHEAHSSRLLDQNARPGTSSSSALNTPEPSHCSLITSSSLFHKLQPTDSTRLDKPSKSSEERRMEVTEGAGKIPIEWNEELRKRREKELKFTAAGWKRDGYGKWYKDENVEFDSDEEDPNRLL